MTALSGWLRLARGRFSLDVRLEVQGGVITTVSGRSGAGKTTLLRCVAGLERDVQGHLRAGDSLWLDSERGVRLPAERRRVGWVSQDAQLFPHLDVRANLLYGHKRLPAHAARVKFDTVVDALGLGPLLERDVEHLSGGERRRVAIGRALLRSPALLLLDEPVSALDMSGRREVLDGIASAVRALGVSCLYVSHDLHEAARLAQRMIWMEAGRIGAEGPIAEVLGDPRLPFAQTEEAAAVVEATVVEEHRDVHLGRLRFQGGELWVSLDEAGRQGSEVRVQIAARDVSLAAVRPERTSVLNMIECDVRDIVPVADAPAQVLVGLSASGTALLARVTRKSAAELDLRPGMRVWALVKSVAILR